MTLLPKGDENLSRDEAKDLLGKGFIKYDVKHDTVKEVIFGPHQSGGEVFF
jgi:hypothetical protein